MHERCLFLLMDAILRSQLEPAIYLTIKTNRVVKIYKWCISQHCRTRYNTCTTGVLGCCGCCCHVLFSACCLTWLRSFFVIDTDKRTRETSMYAFLVSYCDVIFRGQFCPGVCGDKQAISYKITYWIALGITWWYESLLSLALEHSVCIVAINRQLNKHPCPVLVSCRVLICAASFGAVPVVVCYFARPESAHVLPSSNSSEIVMHVAILSCSRVLICVSSLMSITMIVCYRLMFKERDRHSCTQS